MVSSGKPERDAVYLAECGTHAIVDVGFWPYHTSERVGGFRMLHSLGPGMLSTPTLSGAGAGLCLP